MSKNFLKKVRLHKIRKPTVYFRHENRFNPIKVFGYSFGAVVAVVIGPIMFWPVAGIIFIHVFIYGYIWIDNDI